MKIEIKQFTDDPSKDFYKWIILSINNNILRAFRHSKHAALHPYTGLYKELFPTYKQISTHSYIKK